MTNTLGSYDKKYAIPFVLLDYLKNNIHNEGSKSCCSAISHERNALDLRRRVWASNVFRNHTKLLVLQSYQHGCSAVPKLLISIGGAKGCVASL
jgi:hypothetical protein